jgi:hypothetical protein
LTALLPSKTALGGGIIPANAEYISDVLLRLVGGVSVLFKVGRVKFSRGIITSSDITAAELSECFKRYIHGDWGDLHSVAGLMNDIAITSGEEIVATYTLSNGSVICMSTVDGVTSVFLQDEPELSFELRNIMPAV